MAIDLTEGVANYLREVQASLGKFSSSLHLTLKFIGEAEPQGIVGSLNFSFAPFTLTTSQLGCFPSLKNPRVVWVGLKQSQELLDLQRKIDESLPNYLSDHSFHPHITLARIKRPGFQLPQLTLKEHSFEVREFVLYQSILMPAGPVYKKIKGFLAAQT